MGGMRDYQAEGVSKLLASGGAPLKDATPLSPDGKQWMAMFLGAVIALDILRTEGHKDLLPKMLRTMAEITRTSKEAELAIRIMRNAIEGDKLLPALNWLREQRSLEAFRGRRDVRAEAAERFAGLPDDVVICALQRSSQRPLPPEADDPAEYLDDEPSGGPESGEST